MGMIVNPYRFAAGGGWTPLDLGATLLAWYEGDSVSGSDLDPVSTWPDGSGNAQDATSSGTDRPKLRTADLNGLNVLESYESAVNTFMDVPNIYSGTTAGSIFVMVKLDADPPAIGTYTGLMNFGTDSLNNHYPFTDGNIYDGNLSTARKTVGNPAVVLTSWRINGIESAASNYNFWIDGTLFFNTATNTFGAVTTPQIFRSSGLQYLDGRMAALIFTDTVLSSSDREKVEGFWAHKWALTGNLDVSHPYKTTPP